MDVTVIWDSRSRAKAVAALPAQGPLPCRTVLVPREQVQDEHYRPQKSECQMVTVFLTPIPRGCAQWPGTAGSGARPHRWGM